MVSGNGFDPEAVRARYLAERDRRLVPGRSDIRDLSHDEHFARYRDDPFTPMTSRDPVTEDGWFRTGDLARVDEEGFYWIVGRSKDVIISGGENIHPAELENVLADCPEIAEAAVIGIDDPKWGETACACVVSKLRESEILGLFEKKLARYKHPRRIAYFDALPRNAMGKVVKAELKRLLASR